MECPKIKQWARENGCEPEDVCEKAAAEGNLEMLQLARKHGYAWNEKTCEAAAMAGHLEILQWAHANGCEQGADLPENIRDGYGKEREDVVKWLYSMRGVSVTFAEPMNLFRAPLRYEP